MIKYKISAESNDTYNNVRIYLKYNKIKIRMSLPTRHWFYIGDEVGRGTIVDLKKMGATVDEVWDLYDGR